MAIKFKNLSVNGGSSVGGGIIEVDALPTTDIKTDCLYKTKYNKGSIVADGETVVGTIKIDTTKSVEEVVEILSQLEYFKPDVEAPLGMYTMGNFAETAKTAISVIKIYDPECYVITNVKSGLDIIFCSDHTNTILVSMGITIPFTGWNPTLNGVIKINDVSSTTEPSGLSVGSQNDKLVDIIYEERGGLVYHNIGDKWVELESELTPKEEKVLYRNVIKIRSLEYEFDAVFRDVLSYSRITNMQQFVDHIKASIDASDGFFSIDVNTPSNVEDFSMIYTTFNGEKATSDKDYKYEYSLTHKDGSTKKLSGCFDKNLDDLLDTSKFTFIGSACMKIV